MVGAQPDPDPDPDPTYPQWRGEWSAAEDYTAGDHVGRLGGVYRARHPHGAEQMGQWRPESTPTVWEKVA